MSSKSFKQLFHEMKEQDVLSELLYAIYKGTSHPGRELLSQLIFILSKEDLFKLCEYLGGCTITIPTLQELNVFISAITLYYLQNVQALSFREGLKTLPAEIQDDVLKVYPEVERAINEFKGIV